jgi:hypothetical protein
MTLLKNNVVVIDTMKDMLVSNFHHMEVTLTSWKILFKLCYYFSNIITMSMNMISLVHLETKIYKGQNAIMLYISHID